MTASNPVHRHGKKRFPGKPIRYLILTHHMSIHVSGMRTYVPRAATIVVGKW